MIEKHQPFTDGSISPNLHKVFSEHSDVPTVALKRCTSEIKILDNNYFPPPVGTYLSKTINLVVGWKHLLINEIFYNTFAN